MLSQRVHMQAFQPAKKQLQEENDALTAANTDLKRLVTAFTHLCTANNLPIPTAQDAAALPTTTHSRRTRIIGSSDAQDLSLQELAATARTAPARAQFQQTLEQVTRGSVAMTGERQLQGCASVVHGLGAHAPSSACFRTRIFQLDVKLPQCYASRGGS
jgi:hypothetical protein